MSQYDPSTKSVDEVLKKLETASDADRAEILAAERQGKNRKTVLEPYGIDADARVDANGRELYPWEMAPKDHAYHVQVEETDEQREWREQQAEVDEKVAAASAQQPAATAPGSGTAPAAEGAVAGGPVGGAVDSGVAPV